MSDSTTNLDTIAQSQSQKEVTANALFDALGPYSFGGRRASACAGLTWGYYGGRFGGSSIANGTITLDPSGDNYIVANRSTGAISLASDSPAGWPDSDTYVRLYKVVAGASTVSSYEDHRFGPYGILWPSHGAGLSDQDFGFRGIPINEQSGNYTITADDAGCAIYHPVGAGAGDTYTLPSNASVALPRGTAITFINDADAVSIAINSDTLVLTGAGSTGTRTLAQYGVATAVKVTSTRWHISGTGLT